MGHGEMREYSAGLKSREFENFESISVGVFSGSYAH
jgi:hypothetical protein